MFVDTDFAAMPAVRLVASSSTWSDLGSFNFAANRWRGERFPMEPDLVMAITRLIVAKGGRASAVRQIRSYDGTSRLAVKLYLPE